MIKWILKLLFLRVFKQEMCQIRTQYLDKHAPFSIVTDDEDELQFWREINRWADDRNASRYAAKRVDSILGDLMGIAPGDEKKFYICQGQLAEVYKFANLSEFTVEKFKEIESKFTEKTDGVEPENLIKQFGE